MNPEELTQFKKEMQDHVALTIQKVVNGKIDKIGQKLDDYIKDDEKWKVRAEPVVKAFENTSWLFKVFIGFLKVMGLVGVGIGGYMAIKQFFKH